MQNSDTFHGAFFCGRTVVLNVEECLGWSLTDYLASVSGSCAQRLLLPTVNGWLLGYPVVYVVTPECAKDASAILSSCTLRIYKFVLPCQVIAPGCEHRNVKCAIKDDVLYSFTAPVALSLQGVDETWAMQSLRVLSARLAALHGRDSIWGQLKLCTSTKDPGPIAL